MLMPSLVVRALHPVKLLHNAGSVLFYPKSLFVEIMKIHNSHVENNEWRLLAFGAQSSSHP
jgi:hypothetical protein